MSRGQRRRRGHPCNQGCRDADPRRDCLDGHNKIQRIDSSGRCSQLHHYDSRCAHRLLCLIALACAVNAQAMRSPVVRVANDEFEQVESDAPQMPERAATHCAKHYRLSAQSARFKRRESATSVSINPPHPSRLARHRVSPHTLSRKLTLQQGAPGGTSYALVSLTKFRLGTVRASSKVRRVTNFQGK